MKQPTLLLFITASIICLLSAVASADTSLSHEMEKSQQKSSVRNKILQLLRQTENSKVYNDNHIQWSQEHCGDGLIWCESGKPFCEHGYLMNGCYRKCGCPENVAYCCNARPDPYSGSRCVSERSVYSANGKEYDWGRC